MAEVTHDQIDAMRLAADLYAMSAFRAERAVALEAGAPTPRAPKPMSKYMRLFAKGVKEQLSAIAALLTPDELERLKHVGPGLTGRLERNDRELAEEVFALICLEPQVAAAWIRGHIEEIESRLAS